MATLTKFWCCQFSHSCLNLGSLHLIEDSLGWAVVMALDLGQTWHDELARLLLAARFSKAEIDDLRPEPNGGAPPLDADYVDTYRLLGLFARGTVHRHLGFGLQDFGAEQELH